MEGLELTVGDQRFVVRRRPGADEVYDFDWLDGPAGYGFSSTRHGPGRATVDELRASIESFLEQVDPETGYLRD
ncbi:hypothetical protein [Jannaschia sp. R86511]|uniref:hypothetical protein n=1 Tax=Jannaschia sp. R86511 TaxID=3093853 RepID=UPI0036D3EDFD